MKKLISVEEAAAMVKDGMTIMVGGFLAAGSANKILEAIAKSDVKDLTIICNDAAYPEKGSGEMDIEFVPQGTLAERIRAAGAGLGGVLTPTGIGTVIEEGKEKLTIQGKEYLLEMPLHADIALLGANLGDESGNLVYYGTTQNFNPMMATAADLVIAEVQKIVPVGEIPMENVRTQALFVDYMVQA